MKHTLDLHRSHPALWLMGPRTLACQRTPPPTRGNVPVTPDVSAVAVAAAGSPWPEPDGLARALAERRGGEALTQAGESPRILHTSNARVPRTGDALPLGDAAVPRALQGVRSSDSLMPRPQLERRVQASERELLDTPRQSVGQRVTEVVIYVGHEEVLHSATRDVALEVFGGATVNPDADTIDDGADPAAPELKRQREALHGVAAPPRPPRAPAPGAATALAWAPWNVLNLDEALATRDALDTAFLRHERLRFAAPAVAPTLPQTLARARLAPVPVEARAQQPSGRIVPLALP